MNAASLAKQKLAELTQLTARVFGHVHNPMGIRTGNKILRKRLLGPTFAAYYPKEFGRTAGRVERRRRRGKGPPKKGQGKRAKLGKKK
ncbi:hypothetical protein BDF22DRAFT_746025 [Syncephalis plumigaleata]|nr:hypothetical protein BDF22DRAFT_746025 [Syncephalis plumigaleata]